MKALASVCCICGYRVYCAIWELAAAVGKLLVCTCEKELYRYMRVCCGSKRKDGTAIVDMSTLTKNTDHGRMLPRPSERKVGRQQHRGTCIISRYAGTYMYTCMYW